MDSPQPRPKSKKTLWIVLGILFGSLFCCCGGGILLGYMGFQRGAAATREASSFATVAVKEMANDGWSEASARKYGAPAFNATLKNERTVTIMKAWRNKLGKLENLGQFSFVRIFFGTHNGLPPATRVRLSAPATFAKGDGTVQISVAKADADWKIENLDIQSDALIK